MPGRRLRPFGFGLEADSPAVRHAALVEQVLAPARGVLALAASVAAFVNAGAVTERSALDTAIVASVFYSAGVLVLVRARPALAARYAPVLHLFDFGWAALLTLPFAPLSDHNFPLFLFVLVAAGYRWGFWETVATGAFALVSVLGAPAVGLVEWSHPDQVVVHAGYLVVGAPLIGYLAERERQHRRRGWAVARIMRRVRAGLGLVASVRAVLEELVAEFDASHAVLALQEEGGSRVLLWQADREPGQPAPTIRLQQEPIARCQTYLFDVPVQADAWRARRLADGTIQVKAFNEFGARTGDTPRVDPLLSAPFPWTRALCLSSIPGEGWHGRLLLFDASSPGGDQAIRFLQLVLRQVAPALFNLYLQRRLQSRTGVVERARIARELHDGVIQSLIGVEMQLEVLRREAGPSIPDATGAQLLRIQRLLGQEILNVRDLMQLLRPMEVEPARFVEHLAEVIERFQHRTGIRARLMSEVDEVDLSPRACRELARTVQEALTNIRKHSGATGVVVRLAAADGHWQLAIDDNGSGFGFEGRRDHDELDAERAGPLVIKERVRSIGGRLVIHSQPGQGSTLEVSIPRKHHG